MPKMTRVGRKAGAILQQPILKAEHVPAQRGTDPAIHSQEHHCVTGTRRGLTSSGAAVEVNSSLCLNTALKRERAS